MKEVKSWLRQEFVGFAPYWRKCRCGARMELSVNSKGVRYLQHPIGDHADRSHKRAERTR
jgi:hypothetical protein